MAGPNARKRKGRPTELSSINTDDNKSCKLMRSKMRYNFNPFIDLYSKTHPGYEGETFDTLAEDKWTKEVMEGFGGYLVDGINSFQTARNYMSSAINYTRQHFPTLYATMVAPNSARWQQEIKRRFEVECHEERTTLTQHKVPVSSEACEYFCKMLFEREEHEAAALQAVDRSCGGRISEGKRLVCDDIKLKHSVTTKSATCCIQVRWFHHKTDTLTDTYMFVHSSLWASCCLHSLARLFVLCPNTSEALFPTLADSNVVTKMNDHMKSIYAEWKVQDEVAAAQRELDIEMDIYPEEEPLVLREGMTTHGNRAGCIQQARDESIPKSVVLKHCGLKSSYDTNESSYDSVDYASDSQVSVRAGVAITVHSG